MTKCATVSLPLSQRPTLVMCGFGEHGLRGREEYELRALWCLHLYFYQVRVEVGGRSYEIVPGSLTLIPPGTRIVYHYAARRHRHFYVHFAVRKGRPGGELLPVCRHLPEALDELRDRLENIQRVRTRNPAHAEILFWALLWDLAESAARPAEEPARMEALAGAVEELIESGLPGKVSAQWLARELGLSMAHINRTIRQRHGVTTMQFIRKKRMQRAYHLLLHSEMPVKLLAAECGMDDLQQFNKMMRREYGRSPRALRESHQPDPTWAIARR